MNPQGKADSNKKEYGHKNVDALFEEIVDTISQWNNYVQDCGVLKEQSVCKK